MVLRLQWLRDECIYTSSRTLKCVTQWNKPELTNNAHVTAAFPVPFNWVCLANQQVCFSADSITYTLAGCDWFQSGFHASVKKAPHFPRFHLLTHFPQAKHSYFNLRTQT